MLHVRTSALPCCGKDLDKLAERVADLPEVRFDKGTLVIDDQQTGNQIRVAVAPDPNF